MKYILLTLEYPPFFGGVANYYYNLVKYWPEAGGRIEVIDNAKAQLVSDSWPICKWIPAILKLRNALRQARNCYIIVGHILPLGIAALLLSYFYPFKYCVMLHGMDYQYVKKSKRKDWLARKILERSDKVICNSSLLAGQLIKDGFKSCKISAVNPGIGSPPAIDEGSRRSIKRDYDLEGKFVLFTICRQVKRKGIDMVIEAMPEMVQKCPTLYYYIAGKGPDEDYLNQKIDSLPAALQHHIVKLGQITEIEKWAWLSLCDAFIMPSRDIDGDHEGFGIVYLEANLMSKPVIGGKSGGITDAIIDKKTGLLADPNDPKTIADAVALLYGSKELREKLGANGRKRVLEEFSWPEQARKFYEHLSVRL